MPRRCSPSSVHPHERGEHRASDLLTINNVGSSPRAWGTRWASIRHPDGTRFIPTSVGNTTIIVIRSFSHAVHPHERGEHECARRIVQRIRGSSPRAWGTRRPPFRPPATGRFIPTSVGNTATNAASVGLCSVHPHERGEHSASSCVSRVSCGSSPRAWGTPLPATY